MQICNSFKREMQMDKRYMEKVPVKVVSRQELEYVCNQEKKDLT